MNSEISAFHPGEKYGNPVGSNTNSTRRSSGTESIGPYPTGQGGWIKSEETLPEKDTLVSGWNGHCVIYCKYHSDTKKWIDAEGKEETIKIWKAY